MKIERSYFAIELVSGLYKILAAIVLLAGIFIAFADKGLEAFSFLIGGIISAITLFACGELLKLFIHVEENTRRVANLLDNNPVETHQKESIYREGFGDNIKLP